MVGAIDEPHADVLDRVAGHHPFLHRLAHPLLHCGNEGGRDHAPLDLVHELESGLGRQRLDFDVRIAELSPPAGLLLVTTVGVGRLADRLLVGHTRRLERDLGAEA